MATSSGQVQPAFRDLLTEVRNVVNSMNNIDDSSKRIESDMNHFRNRITDLQDIRETQDDFIAVANEKSRREIVQSLAKENRQMRALRDELRDLRTINNEKSAVLDTIMEKHRNFTMKVLDLLHEQSEAAIFWKAKFSEEVEKRKDDTDDANKMRERELIDRFRYILSVGEASSIEDQFAFAKIFTEYNTLKRISSTCPECKTEMKQLLNQFQELAKIWEPASIQGMMNNDIIFHQLHCQNCQPCVAIKAALEQNYEITQRLKEKVVGVVPLDQEIKALMRRQQAHFAVGTSNAQPPFANGFDSNGSAKSTPTAFHDAQPSNFKSSTDTKDAAPPTAKKSSNKDFDDLTITNNNLKGFGRSREPEWNGSASSSGDDENIPKYELKSEFDARNTKSGTPKKHEEVVTINKKPFELKQDGSTVNKKSPEQKQEGSIFSQVKNLMKKAPSPAKQDVPLPKGAKNPPSTNTTTSPNVKQNGGKMPIST